MARARVLKAASKFAVRVRVPPQARIHAPPRAGAPRPPARTAPYSDLRRPRRKNALGSSAIAIQHAHGTIYVHEGAKKLAIMQPLSPAGSSRTLAPHAVCTHPRTYRHTLRRRPWPCPGRGPGRAQRACRRSWPCSPRLRGRGWGTMMSHRKQIRQPEARSRARVGGQAGGCAGCARGVLGVGVSAASLAYC
eukprot:scaffold64777_cov62-Phaeocystis_antarctica.AAC.4